jgi:hypothetical protein
MLRECRNDAPADGGRYGFDRIENMTQECVLDTHSQRAATQHQTEDSSIGETE